MNITIKDFVNSYYEIEFQSARINGPEEAEIFCLTDVHENPAYAHVNSLFINTFGTRVLIEGIKPGKRIKPEEQVMSARFNDTKMISGWDYIDSSHYPEYISNKKMLRLKVKCQKLLHQSNFFRSEEEKLSIRRKFKKITSK